MKSGIKKEFFKYISSNIMGMIGLSCYILVDTYFIAAKMGSQGLTSLNLAISMYSFINGLGLDVYKRQGLKSVEAIVEKYHGDIKYDLNKNKFQVRIIFWN